MFAEAAARAVASPKLVLVGRSVLSEGLRSRLSGLEALGARVEYRSVDVCDRSAVSVLISEVLAVHGRLDGVVHAAGVLRDGLVAGKSAADLRIVLAPKVSGLVALDQVTRDVALQWLACFSSITAVWGNVGQADYAAANAFLDCYAGHRNGLVAQGLRRGRTVSINWPLWAEGGMGLEVAVARRLFERSGMAAMGTASGLAAFAEALASGHDQVLTAEGDATRLRATLATSFPTARAQQSAPSATRRVRRAELQGLSVLECVEWELKDLVASILKVPRDQLLVDDNLTEYGFYFLITLAEFAVVFLDSVMTSTFHLRCCSAIRRWKN